MGAKLQSSNPQFSSEPSNKWILRAPGIKAHPNPQLRLICIPHAGSGAFVYHGWERVLPESVEIIPIEVPGRNSRRKESSPTSVQSFALDLLQGIDIILTDGVPFAFFGHSLGSWMAYAAVQELLKRNGPLPVALYVSGARSPLLAGVAHDPDGVEMHKLDSKSFWKLFEKRYGVNPDLQEESVRQLFEPKLREDFKLAELYRPPVPHIPLRCPLFISVGSDDSRCTKHQIEAWKSVVHADQHVCSEFFKGGHHYLFKVEESKDRFLQSLSQNINKILLNEWPINDEEQRDVASNVVVYPTSGQSVGARAGTAAETASGSRCDGGSSTHQKTEMTTDFERVLDETRDEKGANAACCHVM